MDIKPTISTIPGKILRHLAILIIYIPHSSCRSYGFYPHSVFNG